MTPPPQNELRASGRPVRSDYAMERSYARRRLITLGVMAFIAVGAGYGIWGRSAPNPSDIPTIKAEGSYKEKPADPGGIDIPHQDVQVYDELEGKNTPQPGIEHLLPLPEVPQDAPHPIAAAPTVIAPPPPPIIVPAPMSAPVAAVVKSAPAPKLTKGDPLAGLIPPPPMATTVMATPAPIPAPAAIAVTGGNEATDAPESLTPSPPISAAPTVKKPVPAAPLTIEQVINNTKASAPSEAASSGSVAVQLASSQDKSKAQAMLDNLQDKYSSQLGNAQLRLVAADVAGRGTYYRIQSQGLSEDSANQICASLKQANAGCILVRK